MGGIDPIVGKSFWGLDLPTTCQHNAENQRDAPGRIATPEGSVNHTKIPLKSGFLRRFAMA
jgi:hypothetical protein